MKGGGDIGHIRWTIYGKSYDKEDRSMIICVICGESYLTSDVPAILKYTRNVYYISNLEFVRLTKGDITLMANKFRKK